MRVATCAVCGERLNLLREKLITAEWVDSASGALVAMQFHSPCFVRWYEETASSRAQPEAAAEAPAPAPAPAAAPGPATPPGTESGPPPEQLLSEGEQERLRQLRQRRESEPGSAGAPGQQPEGDQHGVREDDQAPQHE